MLKLHKHIEVKFAEYSDTFSVELKGRRDGKPDCKIGHFGYNRYFRTPYGVKYKQYASFRSLWASIKRVAKRLNLTAESIGIKRGYYKPLLFA